MTAILLRLWNYLSIEQETAYCILTEFALPLQGSVLQYKKIVESEQRRYKTWYDGISLFISTLEEQISQIRSTGFEASTTRYDMPSASDYKAICERDTSGNTWLLKIVLRRGDIVKQLLLWAGYASEEFIDKLKAPSISGSKTLN